MISRVPILVARHGCAFELQNGNGSPALNQKCYDKWLRQMLRLILIPKSVWATAYGLLAIPVAGGLLVRWGLDLPMSLGAVAMSLSTIIVAVNAQTLRRLKLQR